MDKKTFLDDNTTPDIDIEEEKKSDVKFKFLLIILVMVIIVISKLSKNEISISNFSNFTYSFSFHRLYECRNYFGRNRAAARRDSKYRCAVYIAKALGIWD